MLDILDAMMFLTNVPLDNLHECSYLPPRRNAIILKKYNGRIKLRFHYSRIVGFVETPIQEMNAFKESNLANISKTFSPNQRLLKKLFLDYHEPLRKFFLKNVDCNSYIISLHGSMCKYLKNHIV